MSIQNCPNVTIQIGSNSPIAIVNGKAMIEVSGNYKDICAVTSKDIPIPIYTENFHIDESKNLMDGSSTQAFLYGFTGNVIFTRFIRLKTCRVIYQDNKWKVAFDMHVYHVKKSNVHYNVNTELHLSRCKAKNGELTWRQTKLIDLPTFPETSRSLYWKDRDGNHVNIEIKAI